MKKVHGVGQTRQINKKRGPIPNKQRKGINKMQQPQPFESFFGPQMEQPMPISEDERFNVSVLDIANNWEFALEFYDKLKAGTITQVGPMENDWYIFISTYQVQLDTFQGPEEFIELLWKEK